MWKSVVNGADGILAGARPNLIHVDMSTISVTATRRIAALEAEQEVIHIDAPVSGGDVGAKNATLSIMVGADEYALLAIEPILKVMGKRIIHIGPVGSGQIAKACNQIMVAAQMVAMGELLVLAQKAGADPEKVVDAIKGGAAACWTLDNKPQRLFAGNRTPGFKAAMQYKDLNIVMEMAKDLRSAPAQHSDQYAVVQCTGRQRLRRSGQLGRDWRHRTISADYIEDGGSVAQVGNLRHIQQRRNRVSQ